MSVSRSLQTVVQVPVDDSAATAAAASSAGTSGCGVTRKAARTSVSRSEEHTSELQSHLNLVCRLLLEKKKKKSDITLHLSLACFVYRRKRYGYTTDDRLTNLYRSRREEYSERRKHNACAMRSFDHAVR